MRYGLTHIEDLTAHDANTRPSITIIGFTASLLRKEQVQRACLAQASLTRIIRTTTITNVTFSAECFAFKLPLHNSYSVLKSSN